MHPTLLRTFSARATKLVYRAGVLRHALQVREQATADGGPEHDQALHTLAARVLDTVDAHIVENQPPTPEAVAQVQLEAEPLNRFLAQRRYSRARRQEADARLYAPMHDLLGGIHLLGIGYPDMDAAEVAVAAERLRARPLSAALAETVARWPARQRVRLADELDHQGGKLPSDVIAALRTGSDA
ncbi:hypothetical protein ACFPH6_08755 [Streptomyces xiangluensis]|uniref:Uncharacterized protein n=1 Tax=Streptomyces xiangluensis TaxID=2665720 RepID=A0ABV8YH78_9ACTN